MVEQTKWVKAKVRVQWVSDQLESGPNIEYTPPWKASWGFLCTTHKLTLP